MTQELIKVDYTKDQPTNQPYLQENCMKDLRLRQRLRTGFHVWLRMVLLAEQIIKLLIRKD